MGIAMQAAPDLGETPGGLQAPHVVRHDGRYIMFYGDWENICLATSSDGKVFQRRLTSTGVTGMFTEGLGNNTRDPMAILIDGVWHCYYTAFPGQKGAVYCSPDPMDFGIEDDRYLLGKLPIAVPGIVGYEGEWYVACLLPSLKGIRIARMEWAVLWEAYPTPTRSRGQIRPCVGGRATGGIAALVCDGCKSAGSAFRRDRRCACHLGALAMSRAPSGAGVPLVAIEASRAAPAPPAGPCRVLARPNSRAPALSTERSSGWPA